MPTLTFKFDIRGRPVLNLYVSISSSERIANQDDGRPVPVPIPVVALADTGASRTCIARTVLDMLELPMTNQTYLNTASSGDLPELVDLFLVDLAFAGSRTGPFAIDLEVVGTRFMTGLEVGMLLGRDVLDGCLLVYNGPERRLDLAYDSPSVRPDG